MKKSFLLVPLAIILVMSLFLVSCEDEPEIKTYTVTFLLDEGDAEPFDKKTVLEGAGITDTRVPEKTGHKFLHWKNVGGNDAYELNTPVKGDLTLVAVWEINKYTVSFMDGEGKAAEPQTVEYGKTAKAPEVSPKDGHTLSWKKVGSSSPFDFETEVITEDTVLEAVWDINTYTVTFKNYDDTDYSTKDVLYNGKVESPKAPEHAEKKYEFLHWTADAESKEEFKFDTTPIGDNLTLYPVFGIKEFTVTFVGAEGLSSVPEQQIVEYGNYAEDPNAKAKDGYVLNGWKTEGSEEYFDFETKIMSDITLQAVISRDITKAHVSFYDGVKLVSEGYYNIGKTQDFPIYNDVGTGCTLTKWVLESNPEKEYLLGGGFTPVDYKTEYKFYAYITTDLLSIDKNGSVKATNTLKTSNITPLSIPYSINGIKVTAIADNAFLECSNLTSITIPSSVTSIGSSPFKRCNKLTEINVSEKNANFESDNGVLIDVNNKKLICYPAAKSGDIYTVPNTVTTIVDNAFYKCTHLTSIIIPDSVTSIGQYAFYYFSNLTSITIPNSVTSIGQYAFYNCTGLTSITIPNSVTSIGKQAFACSGLTSIAIPSSVTSMGEKAFASCSGLTNITIAEGVTSIGQYAFYNCSGLTSIAIPSSVTSIEKEAFRDCINLTGLSFSGTNSLGIGYAAFMGCSGLKNIDFGNRYTTLNNYAFANCTSLTSVILKGSFTGQNNFNGCTALKSVEIKEGVTAIGDNMFKGCTSLNSVSLPNGIKEIFRNVFEGCSDLQSITLPNSVESIYYNAFASTGLTSITIPSSVTTIGVDAFKNCANLSEINIQKTEGDITGAPWGAPSSTKVTWVSAN